MENKYHAAIDFEQEQKLIDYTQDFFKCTREEAININKQIEQNIKEYWKIK